MCCDAQFSKDLSKEYEDTICSWLYDQDGRKWWEIDVETVYAKRRALAADGPLPTATAAMLQRRARPPRGVPHAVCGGPFR